MDDASQEKEKCSIFRRTGNARPYNESRDKQQFSNIFIQGGLTFAYFYAKIDQLNLKIQGGFLYEAIQNP